MTLRERAIVNLLVRCDVPEAEAVAALHDMGVGRMFVWLRTAYGSVAETQAAIDKEEAALRDLTSDSRRPISCE